jgi:hypothetical protein
MSKQKYPQTTTIDSSGNSTRVKRNYYSHSKLDAKRDLKRREAEDRQFKYDCLTTAQKLKGLGATGSTRQRARLEAQLSKEKAAQVKTAPLTSEQKGDKLVKRVKEAAAAAKR